MTSAGGMTSARSALKSLVVLVVVAVVATGVVLLVKNADGAFSGRYQLVGEFASAGQGLHAGSEVDYRGVQVGTVGAIALHGGQARVVLEIDPGFRFPAAATATVRPQNLFGAEVVDVTSPDGRSGPWLAAGSSLGHTAVASQIGDLFATADPLLQQIDTTDLSAAVSELNQATNGQGGRIASGISEGAALGTLLSNTLSAQLTALDSLTALSAALVPAGPELNRVAAQANASLPAIDNAQADFQHLLDTLTPLATNVAQFLSLYRPDIGTLLTNGDNVTRVLLVHTSDIESLIHGLYRYVTKLAGITGETLPDGSKFAYFRTFIQFGDVNSLVCNLIAPAAPGLAALAPLQQALSNSGSPFDCASQVASFGAVQQATGGTTAPTHAASQTTSAAAQPSSVASSSSAATAQDGSAVAGQVYQTLGAPTIPQAQSLGGYVQMLIGGL